jgi:hypothetical protein
MNYQKSILAVAVAVVLQIQPAWSADNFLPDIQQQGEIYFITGGIGDEETNAMKSERGDYNLQIMSADKQGHFNGYPHIIISDMQHNELVSSDAGPLFYADMPKGKYIVEGSVGKQTQKQNITITGKKTSYIRFVWR